MNIDIAVSNHPRFDEVSRKVHLQPLTIDYRYKVARWPFQLVHYVDDTELPDIPRVSGVITIHNDKIVNPATGATLTPEETEVQGVGEFDFLNNMLKMANVEPVTLITMRIPNLDGRGLFNDYANLMLL